MWVLALILGILFAVFLCILLLLAIPVDLVFHVERDTGFHLRISVRWLFGLVGRDIRRKKEKAEPEKTEEATNLRATATRIFGKARQVMGDEHEREQWNKRRKNTRSMLAMVQTRGFPRKILRFVIDSIRLVRIHRLNLNLRYGLWDPADTGLLFGAIAPTMVYGRSCSLMEIEIQPDFEQLCLQGYLTGDIRVFPIQFAGPVVRLVFSVTTIRAIKAMVVARRK